MLSGSEAGVPVLMYHLVTPRPEPSFRKYSVSSEAFARQMSWLARMGYVPVDLNLLVPENGRRERLPERPVVITFDDGFQDCAEHAVPVLRARGFTATFFLVGGLVGRTSRWLAEQGGPELPLMAWHTARELERAGFQCGAHSLTHPRLGDLAPSDCARELRESKRLLEENLGHRVDHFAYPYGSYDAAVQRMVQETGYRSACSVRIGRSPVNDDVYALHRVPISGLDSLPDFICRLHTGYTLREKVKRTAREALSRLTGARTG